MSDCENHCTLRIHFRQKSRLTAEVVICFMWRIWSQAGFCDRNANNWGGGANIQKQITLLYTPLLSIQHHHLHLESYLLAMGRTLVIVNTPEYITAGNYRQLISYSKGLSGGHVYV